MTDLNQRIAALPPEKRERLLQELQARRQKSEPSSSPTQSIPRQPRGEPPTFPLSFSQQRLWFLDRLESDSPFYNVPAAVEIKGRLDVPVLTRCLSEIIRRHEVLRSRFGVRDTQPVQIVEPPPQLNIPVIDLQLIPPQQRWERALHLARTEASQPFDLSSPHLVRLSLLQLEGARHILLFVTHHIVSDAWSRGVMLRELNALYPAFAAGKPSPLPELPIQYGDFAAWQRQQWQDGAWQSQLDYWKRQLSDPPPALDLPLDRPRPPRQTFRGATESFVVPSDRVEALQSLARRYNATPYMVLLAAFKVLLHRYSGQADLAVGSPIANRNRAPIEPLMGFFANTLVLRTDLSGEPSFAELLDRVREVALGAYSHQDVPFEKLVEVLQPQRDLSRPPLFQVLFAFHDLPVLPDLPGLTFEPLKVDSGTSKFDLSLLVRLDPQQGAIATLEYNLDLFEPATIARLARHFQTLLGEILARPDAPISQLSLLSADETTQLLHGWNQTDIAYPDETVVDLFDRQVARTPEAIAVTFGEQTLTYGELSRQANQLARRLRELGVKPDVPVGMFLERSLALSVAVLGILKAGGACLPLDPNYPAARLQGAIADSQTPVILTTEGLRSHLPPTEAEAICLEMTEGDRIPDLSISPDSLAYVIYTSGSTGQPKGVAMNHRPLHNLICWQRHQPGHESPATTLQFASPSFDVFFQECFATWSVGGNLVLVGEAERRNGERLLDAIDRCGIERIFLPFVALSQLAETARRRGCVPMSLRQAVTAGEQLQITPAIAQFFRQLPDCTLHNQYGPSESHVVAAHALTGAPETWSLLPPIGRAIANVKLYLLDSNLQPVPIGVPGELYIGGTMLARGYLNRPDLTVERFIADPFVAGETLYRTGDLARYDSDGNLHYLGRADRQVKLRGFRVELGEIEAVLAQHPGVREVAVVMRDRRLIAYVVPQHSDADEGQLRTFLTERLPDYMVPSIWMTLEALPLTPSGKVDRRSLPVPKGDRPSLATSYVAPRTDLERRVARIWREVLQVEKVGIYDNFFDLGGHSLLTVQLGDRLQSELERAIPLTNLFQYPTVAALVDYFNRQHPAETEAETVRDRGRSRRENLQRQRRRRR